MYFNYITNSFSPSPKEKTREETVIETVKELVTEIGTDEDGNEHEVQKEVEKEVEKTVTVEIPIPEDCVEVDDELCETMFNEVDTSTAPKAIFANEYTHYPEVRELEIVVDPIAEKRTRIAELKQKLSETDYMAIKWAEGFLSDSEYAPMKVLRQAYRDEINQLELEIGE